MDGGTDDSNPGGPAASARPAADSPPPPPPPPPARRVVRRGYGKAVAGVAGGLADYFGIDALFVRIGFIALAFAGGVGILLYVAAWLLMPLDGTPEAIAMSWPRHLEGRRAPAVAGAVLLFIAFMIIVGSSHVTSEGFIWGLALVGLGVLLLTREAWPASWSGPAWGGPQPSGATTSSFSAMPPAPVSAPQAPIWRPAPAQSAWSPRESLAAPPPAQARPRSVLGLVTVALALLVAGVAALLDNLGVVSVTFGNGLAMVLIVLGLGLVAGAWWGRSRALIVLAIALLPFTVAASLIDEPFGGGAGDRSYIPHSLAEVQTAYQLGAGQITVDLSQVNFAKGATINASVAVGDVSIVIPAGVSVVLDGHVGAGELDLLGHVDDGLQVDHHLVDSVAGSAGTIHLNVSAGLGHVRVSRADTIGGVTP